MPMMEWFERHSYLLLGVGGLLFFAWYLRGKARQRGPGEERGLAEKLLDPFNVAGRRLTKRELYGWAIVGLLMIGALIFAPSGRG
jgi:hypothetical protein